MADVTEGKEGICARLAEARETAFGPRGRAAFARALGLSPSTYIYYEKGRVPPPDVLARAAEVAGLRLQWLVTGKGPRDLSVEEVRRTWQEILPPEIQPALDRFIEQAASPEGAPAAVRALAELLQDVGEKLPHDGDAVPAEEPLQHVEGMIPVLGRTAAGLVGRHDELLGEEPAVTIADIARAASGRSVRRRPVGDVETDDPVMEASASQPQRTASLVQLAEPLPSGVVELVDVPPVRQEHPAAFALRVDGESMAPRFRHGDVVIADPSRPVRSGQAALVQIRGRVGVTLKLLRQEEDSVALVPINERYDTEIVSLDQVEWTAPVLCALRFRTGRS